ncbi:MAG: flagellin [Stellaceae bacterium]
MKRLPPSAFRCAGNGRLPTVKSNFENRATNPASVRLYRGEGPIWRRRVRCWHRALRSSQAGPDPFSGRACIRRQMMLAGSIDTNVNALYALNALNDNGNRANTLEQQLSTGLAINSPADNPAGYIAAQNFTAQISGVTQATSNANQAISLVQTADGAITQQVNILQNIASIANQAANGGATSQQLAALQQVVAQLQTQVSTISTQTNFNGVNLLDGSFQGINFQVGAQAGQTIGLSLANTAANQIGSYESGAAAGGIYTTDGVGTGGVADNTGASYAITASGTGAFVASGFGVSGSAGNATIAVTSVTESAQGVAQAVNLATSSTNVEASAVTSIALTVTAGSLSFSLGNGTGAAQTNTSQINATVTDVSQAGLAALTNQINQATSQTGVTATVNSSSQLVLTQASGDNVSIGNFAGTGTLAAGGTTLATAGTVSATIQGKVTLQSNQSFALSAQASDVGLAVTSNLSNLSGVNVSTAAGATAALNVVTFALQQLESVGSQLGAVQQRLQATVGNLQTTNTNLTAARSTVEDANIPQVTTQLTQAQILQQAGVSALTQSTSLQQSFLKLLQ